jgi:hypothetical protein
VSHSNHPETLDAHGKDDYWAAVADCLHEFHTGFDLKKADSAVSALKYKVESTGFLDDPDVFYHAEPFYVACDIARMTDTQKQDDLLARHRVRYQRILRKHRL